MYDRYFCCGACEAKAGGPITGSRPPREPEGGEPEWSEPTDAERTWARATMPDRATGHTIGWRAWGIHLNVVETVADQLTTEDLRDASPEDAWDALLAAYRQAREGEHEPRYLLQSASSHYTWPTQDPVVAINRDGMPAAKGAGVYAFKEASQLNSMTQEPVVGEVALWGEVIEHEQGYRARYAYPARLWVRPRVRNAHEVARELGRTYGVPCEVGTPEGVGDYDPVSALAAHANQIMAQMAAYPGAVANMQQPTFSQLASRQGSGLLGGRP